MREINKRASIVVIRNESGEVMIESMLVLIPILFTLVFLLCLGFFFYQQWNIQITANETAARVAEVYPLLESDLKTGPTDYSQIQAVDKYRYLNIISGDEYESENNSRGETYGQRYLSLVSLAYPNAEPQIQVETVEDAFASRHVNVTVTGTYRLPFAEGFEVFGLKDKYTFEAQASAVCTDLSDYLGSVNYVANLEELLQLKQFDGYKAANSILDAIKKVAKAIKSFD